MIESHEVITIDGFLPVFLNDVILDLQASLSYEPVFYKFME